MGKPNDHFDWSDVDSEKLHNAISQEIQTQLEKEFQHQFRDRVDELFILERQALKQTELLQAAHQKFLTKMESIAAFFNQKQTSLMNTTELYHNTNKTIKENLEASEQGIKRWTKVYHLALAITLGCVLVLSGTGYFYVKRIQHYRHELSVLKNERTHTPIIYTIKGDDKKEREYVLVQDPKKMIERYNNTDKQRYWFAPIEHQIPLLR